MRAHTSRCDRERSAPTWRRGARIARGYLLLLCACAAPGRQSRVVQPAPADTTPPATGALPAARPCMSIARLQRSEIIDNQTIRFHLIDGTIVLSRLPNPCPGLEMQGGFAFRTSTDQLCELDVIRVLPPSGGACALGTFEIEHLAPGAEQPR